MFVYSCNEKNVNLQIKIQKQVLDTPPKIKTSKCPKAHAHGQFIMYIVGEQSSYGR